MIVVGSGTLLTNRNIGGGDTRRFVANLLEHHSGSGARDLRRHAPGLSTLYDSTAFFKDSRLHATLGFLIAAWLVYLLGSSNRLVPPVTARAAPRQSDFLAAAGGFMARRLDRCAAGLLLIDEWFDEVRRARRLPSATVPPWAELAATPTLARATLDELRDSHDRARGGPAR